MAERAVVCIPMAASADRGGIEARSADVVSPSRPGWWWRGEAVAIPDGMNRRARHNARDRMEDNVILLPHEASER
jgi:hypothetical protein